MISGVSPDSGHVVPRELGETTTRAKKPHTSLQGEGGARRHQGAKRTLAQLPEQFDVHPNQITSWKAQLEGGAADVFGPGVGNPAAQPAVDVKTLHAKDRRTDA